MNTYMYMCVDRQVYVDVYIQYTFICEYVNIFMYFLYVYICVCIYDICVYVRAHVCCRMGRNRC